MSDLAKRLAALSPEKRELLRQRLNQQRQTANCDQIKPQSRTTSEFPLSFAQQRLWFLDQLEPGNPFYNVPAAVQMTGVLDRTLLERCFNEIIRRHEVLRTRFAQTDNQPIQIISPPPTLNIPVVDLQQLPQLEQTAEVQRLAKAEACCPFDLTQVPLLRATLLQLAPAEQVLLFTTHHIISDAWSRGVLIRELTILYAAFAAGKPSPLPDLNIQYADFAVWQRQWLQGEVWQTQLSYWKQQLDGDLPVLNLPTDYPRTAMQTFRGAQQLFTLSPLTAALTALSQQQGVTLFMTLLAAFQLLLHRYSGQTDITVGSPIANRNRTEIEGLIGFFANTLVLRTDLSGNPSFAQLLQRVREVALGAYAHQDLPFEKLVEELQPTRNLSYPPMFQVMFAFHDLPVLPTLPGINLSLLNVESEAAKFDLTLLMRLDSEQRLIATLEYNRDLFAESTIARMVQHFQTLLDNVVTDPQQPISTISLLSAGEKQQLLVGWNNTEAEYPQVCIDQLFATQVERTPDAVAVTFAEERLTYRELNAKANQLARKLQSLGVDVESRVGICLERSLNLAIAVLGVLKAGGAYVPLDPTYPSTRLEFMLTDAQVSVLLTEESLQKQLPATTSPMLCLDLDWESIAAESTATPATKVNLDCLAYVIYTSGSTGQPKGVAISHRPLCNLISWQLQNSQLGVEAKTLQFASLSFDVSFQEIFATWCAGGTLVLIPETLRQDPTALLQFLHAQKIERLFLPFIALTQLATAVESQGTVPVSLREVVTAGEQLQIHPAIAKLFTALPNCSLQNQYGPSETHVVTAFTLTGSPTTWQHLPPIGRPIHNVQIYLLDTNLQPVPVGIPGELYIGGVALARGYLNRQQLTEQRFIANPFYPGTRLYKTGDLARYRTDGNIEFLGRIDQQVKLRGFRIEPGEIEAVLSQHPQVQEAVVIVREDTPGDRRLVAYFVSDSPTAINRQQLGNFLKSKLPDYMIPSRFVDLEALPLTPSGKIDRRALPAPTKLSSALTHGYVAPQSETERAIATIWQQLLNLETVGIDDNFFDLGGHSLLIVQARSKLEAAFERKIAIVELFQYPTISALAQHLNQPLERSPHLAQDHRRVEMQRTSTQQQRQLRQRHRARK